MHIIDLINGGVTLLRKPSIALTLIFALVVGCVQEVDVFDENVPTLVIDGVLTNEAGPHRVRLAFSSTYNAELDFSRVDNAVVTIVDDLENRQPLEWVGEGNYETPIGYTGTVGRSYYVEVLLEDGKEYRSHPEMMREVPVIENVTYDKVETDLHFFADFQDTPGEENFYRWRYRGTYEVRAPIAYEMSLTNKQMKNDKCYTWDGKPPLASEISDCWITQFDTEFLRIESDHLFDGRQLSNFPIVVLPMDRKLDRGYMLEIKQQSLSKEAFKYWKALEEQNGNSGTIFETNNYQIRGNLYSTIDDEELVLGYFGVSAVSSQRVNVFEFMGTFGDIPCETNNSGCYPTRCMDCRKFGASATTTQPDFWPL